MSGVSSFNVGTIAGREPVAMTMRSNESDSCEPSNFVTRSVVEFSKGTEFDSPVFRLLRFFDQLRDVEQRFRWDAAAVEADAAGVYFRVDEGDGHAEIGGEECSGVSTGTAAD